MFTFGNFSFEFMSVIDCFLIIYGAYSLLSSRKMKSEGKPPQWLMSIRDQARIRKPQDFCDHMAPRTIIFGFMCIIYGVYGLVETYYIKNDAAEMVGVTIFVVCLIWFIISLSEAKRKFI